MNMKNNQDFQVFTDNSDTVQIEYDALLMEFFIQFKTLAQSLASKNFWDSQYFGVIIGGVLTFVVTILHERYKEHREAKKQRESKFEEMKIELSMLTAYLDNYATERYTYFNSLIQLLNGVTQRSNVNNTGFSHEENRYFLKTSDERSYKFAESITLTKARLEVLQGNYNFYFNDELKELILDPLSEILDLIRGYEKCNVANGALDQQFHYVIEKIEVIRNNIKLLKPL